MRTVARFALEPDSLAADGTGAMLGWLVERGIDLHIPVWDQSLRLIRALAVEMHENWLEAPRYLNIDDLREHKKEVPRMAG
jgi:hypothetical protein